MSPQRPGSPAGFSDTATATGSGNDGEMNRLRIAALGNGGVGKSALIVQFVHARFLDDYDPTIEDSYKKQCVIDEEMTNLDILDTSGQEDYSSMGDNFMQKGDGFLLVFSIDSKSSFQAIRQLRQQILSVKNTESFPMLIVGNKSDLDESLSSEEGIRQVSTEEAKNLAKEFNCKYVETSAKIRHNVEEAFHGLAREVRKYKKELGQKEKLLRKKRPITPINTTTASYNNYRNKDSFSPSTTTSRCLIL